MAGTRPCEAFSGEPLQDPWHEIPEERLAAHSRWGSRPWYSWTCPAEEQPRALESAP